MRKLPGLQLDALARVPAPPATRAAASITGGRSNSVSRSSGIGVRDRAEERAEAAAHVHQPRCAVQPHAAQHLLGHQGLRSRHQLGIGLRRRTVDLARQPPGHRARTGELRLRLAAQQAGRIGQVAVEHAVMADHRLQARDAERRRSEPAELKSPVAPPLDQIERRRPPGTARPPGLRSARGPPRARPNAADPRAAAAAAPVRRRPAASGNRRSPPSGRTAARRRAAPAPRVSGNAAAQR